MTDLRKYLQAEKARHEGFVYPGNLAADILGAAKAKPATVMDYADSALRRRSPLLKWILGFGSLAAAALVTLFLYTHHESVPANPGSNDFAINTNNNNDDEQISIAPDQTASINDVETQSIVPSDVDSLVPTFQSMSMPSIPSFSDLSISDEDNSSTNNTQT